MVLAFGASVTLVATAPTVLAVTHTWIGEDPVPAGEGTWKITIVNRRTGQKRTTTFNGSEKGAEKRTKKMTRRYNKDVKKSYKKGRKKK